MLNYGSSRRVGSSYIKSEITAKFFYKKTQYSISYKSFSEKLYHMSEYRNKKKVIFNFIALLIQKV